MSEPILPAAEPTEADDQPSPDELKLVQQLRKGDEATFVELSQRYSSAMLRVGLMYVSSRAVAEEVVQEAWLGVVKGIGRFEGRSSLKTWLFRILTNVAKTKGQRESRSIPFSSYWTVDSQPFEPSVDPDRFLSADHPRWPGHWSSPPRSWEDLPEERLLSDETRAIVMEAVAALPPSQKEVITLRDVEGWTSVEVCNALSLSETNQKVLLHRARGKVRRALETYLAVD